VALTLYKYLDLPWAERFVSHGLARFSSLSWFQDFEDEERGDQFEGIRKYFPAGGLTPNRISEPAGPVNLPHHSFQSPARERDRIFIFSTSRTLSSELAAKFARPEHKEMACVEIRDADTLFERVGRALKKRSPVQRRTLFHTDVIYYAFEEPPGVAWALPDMLATHKERRRFLDQAEHRFIFSTKRHAYDPNRVEAILVNENHRMTRPKLDPSVHCNDLVLGCMGDCCELIRFPKDAWRTAGSSAKVFP
jgi:hypothetical protein